MKVDHEFAFGSGEGWPDMEKLKDIFLNYETEKWDRGGSEQGWISLYGYDNTEHLPRFKGCIEVDLTFVHCDKESVYVYYSKYGNGSRLDYYLFYDPSRLGDNFPDSHGSWYSRALVIPYELGWKIAKEFIETKGKLPKCVTWTEAEDLPDAAFYDDFDD